MNAATSVSTAPRAAARPPSRARSGRVAWAVVAAATLALKTFVPLLAAVSAQLQGKAVADVCAVYGVRLAGGPSVAAAPAHHHHHHGEHAAHGEPAAPLDVAMAGADVAPSPSQHGPADHADHTRDHCALTGLAVCAVLAAAAWDVADWAGSPAPPAAESDVAAASRDASARWLTLRVHAPPAQA